MKLKADFDYICSPDSPMNTYTSNPANLGENADIAAKDNGFTVTNYNKETNEILKKRKKQKEKELENFKRGLRRKRVKKRSK